MKLEASNVTLAGVPIGDKPTAISLRQSIVQIFDVLTEPDQVTEVRIFGAVTRQNPFRHTAAGFFKYPEKLLVGLDDVKAAEGVYFTPNPINPTLFVRSPNRLRLAGKGELTQDIDIVKRRWMLIDIDPRRPASVSSTRAELDAAVAVCNRIIPYLNEQGWPLPVSAMSGNGIHLLYRIDLPTDDGGIVRRCLEALAKRFDDDHAEVDRSVCNPARLTRLYGTMNCKGPPTAERTHRMSRILTVPERVEVVDRKLLDDLAAETGSRNGKPRTNGCSSPISQPIDVAAFVREHGLDVTGPEPWSSGNGLGQCWVFQTSPLCSHNDGAAHIVQLGNGAVKAGCHHAHCTWDWKALRAHCEAERPKPTTDQLNRQPDGNGSNSVALRPKVPMPGGRVQVTDTARKLGRLLGSTGRYFRRGRSLAVVRRDHQGIPTLDVVNAIQLISVVEDVCQPVKSAKNGDVNEPTILARPMADAILSADGLFENLPPINAITRCSILLERAGQLYQVTGYDPESGIYANGQETPELSLEEAREILATLLGDFHFASRGDRSRAFAAMITPALVLGGLLPGRAPVAVIEADKSQAGKGYFVKVIAAIYGDIPATVADKKDGVGSIRETFDAKVLEGRAFISLDNIRGRFDRPELESFLTETEYTARVPYGGNVQVDPRKTIVLLTSNRAQFTNDFANRSSVIRLRKQKKGYGFRKYPEGDLLKHVEENRHRYQAAVFSIVKAWHKRGRPSSDDVDHDFHPWASTLDWIVVNLLGEAPLMEGHEEIKQRTVSSALTWLRDVAHAVETETRLGKPLRPSGILDVLSHVDGIEIPGLKGDSSIEEEATRNIVFRAIGKRMSDCMEKDDQAEVDGYIVHRHITTDHAGHEVKEYIFERSQLPSGSPKSPGTGPEAVPEARHHIPQFPE